jgi:hypothetical protein
MAETIALSEIKSLAVRLFETLEERGFTHAKVPNPQYWTVSLDAFETDQPQPTMGDVWDDLHDLKGEMAPEDDEHEVIIWHAFHHLSGLTQFISNADMNGELLVSERRAG